MSNISNALFAPILFYILWVAILYILLTIMRAPTIWNVGAKANGENPYLAIEQRTSANLSNQFEWPVLFYTVCIILIARPEFYKELYLWFAWVFVIGRVVHSIVQIFTTNVRLRGSVFNINFLAVIALWAFVGIDALSL